MRRPTRPRWLGPTVIGSGLLAAGSGMAQFGVTAVLGDVGVDFGAVTASEAADQVGLSATTLGIGLALVRLAGAGSLVGSSLADRFGRRPVMLWAVALGMVSTGIAAVMPGWWAFVAVVAVARPLLSTTNALTVVIGAEESSSSERPLALAFVGAAYGLGTGAVPLLRAVVTDIDWRLVLGIAAVPVLLVPLVARMVREPAVASELVEASAARRQRLGSVPREHLRDLVVVCLLIGLIAVGTGPAFTYLFVYGEQVLDMSPVTMFQIVFAAGPTGLVGLLLGSWLANRIGRRWTAALATVGTLLLAVVAYAGSPAAFVVGYLAGITLSSAFGPASGALLNELFPTTIRATANGWAALSGVFGAVGGLLLFGRLADALGSFGAATRALLLPLLPVVLLYLLLPETLGREIDEHRDAPADVVG